MQPRCIQFELGPGGATSEEHNRAATPCRTDGRLPCGDVSRGLDNQVPSAAIRKLILCILQFRYHSHLYPVLLQHIRAPLVSRKNRYVLSATISKRCIE